MIRRQGYGISCGNDREQKRSSEDASYQDSPFKCNIDAREAKSISQ